MPVLTGGVIAAVCIWANGPVPAPLTARIDRLVAAGHPDYSRHAAPRSSDAEFLRRVTLDLAGTVPTAAEVRAFLADPDPNKRARRIDALLAGPEFVRRLVQVYDIWFMERRKDEKVTRAAWEGFLRSAVAANAPYDRVVRDILSADGVEPAKRAPAKFYLDRDFEPNLVTRDIGRLFLGRDWQCAQCHDHPAISEYTQADYHGLYAFLSRSYLFPDTMAVTAVLAEKADGNSTFMNVFDKTKRTHSARPRLPDTDPVVEPRPAAGMEYAVAPAKGVRPVPTYSRRARLAGRVIDHPAFARTAANRFWAMLMGRGLVHPLDQDHSDNPASHPELLKLLADEFAAHRFDVRWFLRQIARSETYQRSSERTAGQSPEPANRLLAAELKPLSPEQFAGAVLRSTGRKADAPQAVSIQQMFAGGPGEADDGFTPSLGQTLSLKHGGNIRGLLAPSPGTLTDRLAKLTDDRAVADELFLSVLGRSPTTDERGDVTAALAGVVAKDRPAVVAELTWAVLASAEFRFNH